MDRKILAQHLAEAEEHVMSDRRAIIQQRELILNLERDGHDTGEARGLLATYEELHEFHLAERDHLLKEFAERTLVSDDGPGAVTTLVGRGTE